MNVTAVVKEHLPRLRRFARALTGTQTGGDAYVAEVLEALVADPATLDRTLEPRAALYRALVKTWDSIDMNHVGEPAALAFERNLTAIPPKARQAFLLRTVEEFSVEESAAILGVDEFRVRELIDEAGREIANQIATDLLIIEDEMIIAMDLESIMRDLGHRVTAMVRTRSEALEAVKRKRPGLVLADIQLADDSSGLDAVNDMLEKFDVPVVFVTAHPDRLLTGKRPEPSFLITKPFQPDMVKAIVSQALFFDTRATRSAA